MKLVITSSIFVIFAIGLYAAPDAFAAPGDAYVENAQGSSTPGCEETNECFIPSTVTIRVGGVVEFANYDSAAHTSTSGTPADGANGVWDSSLVMVGMSYTTPPLDVAGEYPYFCMVHPWMTGLVIVDDDHWSAPTPEPEYLEIDYVDVVEGSDFITIAGTAASNTTADVRLMVLAPHGNVVAVDQLSPDSDGIFVTTINFDGQLWSQNGVYSFELSQGSATIKFEIEINNGIIGPPDTTPTSPTLIFSTDKTSYEYGDQIIVTGSVSHMPTDETVSLSVEDENQYSPFELVDAVETIETHLASVDSSGNFMFTLETTHQNGKVYGFTNLDPDYVIFVTALFDPEVMFGLSEVSTSRAIQVSGWDTSGRFWDWHGGAIENAPGSSTPGCEETNECFIPATLTIAPGEYVTFNNNDSVAHTATSGTPSDGADGVWDSGLRMPGVSYSVTLNDGSQTLPEGTYPYFCMVHPWMTGTIIVGDGVTQTIPEAEAEAAAAEAEAAAAEAEAAAAEAIAAEAEAAAAEAEAAAAEAIAAAQATIDAISSVSEEIEISMDFANDSDESQPFAYIVQIKNEDNLIISVSYVNGLLGAGQSLDQTLSYTPDETGTYTAEKFLWSNLDNPTALTDMKETFTFSVV